MSFGQNEALVMLYKFVMFDENSLHFVNSKSYGRDMVKIGKICGIAIYGKVTSAPSGHVF